MEFSILYKIQEMNHAFLDPFMIGFSTLGNSGICWIVITVILLLSKKYRECGVVMGVALLMSFLFGNLLLKNLVERSRPYWIDENIVLKIPESNDYSFPSGHTFSSFSAATAIFLYYRKAGVAALILGALIAFSRLYLFMHFPSDVLAGLIFGVFSALFAAYLVRKYLRPVLIRRKWIISFSPELSLPEDAGQTDGTNEDSEI
jgi:undecaprenyl-diphosphatase